MKNFGGLAQLGERLLCKQEVVGSIPSLSTKSNSGCKSVRSDGLLWEQEAAGSNPATRTIFNALAVELESGGRL